MTCIKKSLVFILHELFPLDGFSCYFVSAPQYECKLDSMFDIILISRTGHVIVSQKDSSGIYSAFVTAHFIYSSLSAF